MTEADYVHRVPREDGEISRKRGNTRVSTVRRVYGRSFAPDAAPHDKRSAVRAAMDGPSLSRPVHDHGRGVRARTRATARA